MANLKNKVAVVTGGASGIGRATAILLAEHGAQVVVWDLEHLAENRDRFEELGIACVTCDVRDEEQVAKMMREAALITGRIDILVNNAGVHEGKQVTECTEAEWDRCLDTHVKAAFLTSKHAIPLMRPEGGSIINMSSNAGLLPRAADPVYSTSKAALIGFTRALALSNSVDKIRVNAVCPGPVGPTAIMDAGIAAAPDPEAARQALIEASPLARAHERMITPEEIAHSVLYLASDASAMVTGTAMAIDGGKSLGVPPKVQ